jgi:hypothetical protein
MYTRSEGLGLQHFLLCLSPIHGHGHAFDSIHCPKNHYILTYPRFESLELQHFLLCLSPIYVHDLCPCYFVENLLPHIHDLAVAPIDQHGEVMDNQKMMC